MKHTCNTLFILFSILLATTACADDGWEVLFNGKELSGWSAITGKGAFTVADGTIRANAPSRQMDHLFYVGDGLKQVACCR